MVDNDELERRQEYWGGKLRELEHAYQEYKQGTTDEAILGRIIVEARRNSVPSDWRNTPRRETDFVLSCIVAYNIFPLLVIKYKGLGRFAFIKRWRFRLWWHKAFRGEATVEDMPV